MSLQSWPACQGGLLLLGGPSPCLLSAPCPPPTSHLPAQAVPPACCSVHARPSRWTEWLVGFLAPRPPLPPGAVVVQQGPSRALSWAWRRRPADGVLRSPGRALRGESSHPGTKCPETPAKFSWGRGVSLGGPGASGEEAVLGGSRAQGQGSHSLRASPAGSDQGPPACPRVPPAACGGCRRLLPGAGPPELAATPAESLWAV